ncbi:C45 family autoproteolytic acyltransferase/hydrolase [Jeotgalibacillus sp. ET6]|uniref:C45 family autoproteolytic acyltransferase/hydolase n=1 Tax=Jeotgalibacillus sp. ET6 TaxID=3037260 RepID=UPI00241841D3|nr:C45 family peptidase [Jeotgalibacillus sp. ET6]MDG5473654.1 C45 family autoproteolytic acyltransferase/hydrolase [Jeotgalibacillus sp. ET6]
MKTVHSDILQYRGTHYDFGFFQGRLLRDSLTVENREKQWKVRKPRFEVEEGEVKEAIRRFTPGLWEELLGIRDALDWPMDRVMMEFGGYRVDYNRSGCSIMTGDGYMIRNYDYMPKTYEGRFIFYQPTDSGYAIAGPSQRITGRMDGMNEHGLSIGYNFMNRKRPGDGFICCTIGRMILESCSNVDEAVQMLKEIPHRHSFSYTVFDKTNQSFVIETSPRGVEVRHSDVCTNHFEIMKKENRYHLVDSIKRMEAIRSQRNEVTTPYGAFRLMNDTDKGVFSKLYRDWAGTIHTSGYLPREMKIWFALGGDQEPSEFNFGEWLNGEDILIEKITGDIDTDIPFVHIDKGAYWSVKIE